MSSQQHVPTPHRTLRPEWLLALYLGARTLVIGQRGVSLHRHTRGTLDRGKPVIGIARLRRAGELDQASASA